MDRGFLSNIELQTPRGRFYYVLTVISLSLVAIVTVFPFVFAFTSGLKGSTEIFQAGLDLWPSVPQWQNYHDAWTQFNMSRLFGNSLVIVGVGVLLRILVSASAAFSLSKLKPTGGRIPLIPRWILGNWWSRRFPRLCRDK